MAAPGVDDYKSELVAGGWVLPDSAMDLIARCAMALEVPPDDIVVMMDGETLEALLEAEDESGDPIIPPNRRKLIKAVVKKGVPGAVRGLVSIPPHDDKGAGVGSNTNENPGKSPLMQEKDVQTVQGAARAQSISPHDTLCLGVGFWTGKYSPTSVDPDRLIKSDPQQSEEMKTRRKAKQETLETLQSGFKSGGKNTTTFSDYNAHFRELADSCANHGRNDLAVHVSTWFHRTAECLGGAANLSSAAGLGLLVDYITLYGKKYNGLGFPVAIDTELMFRVNASAGGGRIDGGGPKVEALELKMPEMAKEIEEARKQVAVVAKELRELRESVRTVKSKVASLGSSSPQSGPSTRGTATCFVCGKKGHLAPNCPDKEKNEEGDKEE